MEVGDEIVGRWKEEGFDWYVMNDNAVLIENTLDTTKYKFRTKFPVTSDGIPTLKGYTDNNSFDLGFRSGKIVHSRGAIVE